MSDKKQKTRRAEVEPKKAAPKIEPAIMFQINPDLKQIAVDPGPMLSQFAPPAAPLSAPVISPNLKEPANLAECFTRASQEIDPNMRTVGMVDLSGVLKRLAELFAGVER